VNAAVFAAPRFAIAVIAGRQPASAIALRECIDPIRLEAAESLKLESRP